jgi:hypothetical protein
VWHGKPPPPNPLSTFPILSPSRNQLAHAASPCRLHPSTIHGSRVAASQDEPTATNWSFDQRRLPKSALSRSRTVMRDALQGVARPGRAAWRGMSLGASRAVLFSFGRLAVAVWASHRTGWIAVEVGSSHVLSCEYTGRGPSCARLHPIMGRHGVVAIFLRLFAAW